METSKTPATIIQIQEGGRATPKNSAAKQTENVEFRRETYSRSRMHSTTTIVAKAFVPEGSDPVSTPEMSAATPSTLRIMMCHELMQRSCVIWSIELCILSSNAKTAKHPWWPSHFSETNFHVQPRKRPSRPPKRWDDQFRAFSENLFLSSWSTAGPNGCPMNRCLYHFVWIHDD